MPYSGILLVRCSTHAEAADNGRARGTTVERLTSCEHGHILEVPSKIAPLLPGHHGTPEALHEAMRRCWKLDYLSVLRASPGTTLGFPPGCD